MPALAQTSTHTIFGIRHHGPGSTRSLLQGLKQLQPDCILIEGPPEANELIKHVNDERMKPPVSLLIYACDDLSHSVFYPFAVFSPEWQAMNYAVLNNIPVRFMDLPQSNWLALQKEKAREIEEKLQESSYPDTDKAAESSEEDRDEVDREGSIPEESDENELSRRGNIRRDPLSWLAKAAGYEDSERWWESLVEHRRADLDVFAAIKEAMTTLRRELKEDELRPDPYEALREAQMRQNIRIAMKEGFKQIAVVCGAWHTPALEELPPAGDDQALLRKLPKLKVESTWIPWTNARLSSGSGYGAGVESPGWYHHIFSCRDLIVERWMSNVARLLREEDLDASSANIIETVRLSEALAAMRGQALPGLAEVTEASQAVLCFGNPVPMQLIHEKLIVGEIMGEVPPELPGTPLQKDLEKQQKSLRMPASAAEKLYDLDLRNANDLKRSHLLHRLEILEIKWGDKETVTGKSGTFHEVWRLRWQPEMAIKLIEASVWGKTIDAAATAYACDLSDKAGDLSKLTRLLDTALLADLPSAIEHIMSRLETEAAIAVDVKYLMAALPSLVNIARYGNVRKTDFESVQQILDGLISRICIGLPAACPNLDDNASQEIFDLILKVHSSIDLLQNQTHSTSWLESLSKIADGSNINGLVSGRAARILFDRKVMDSAEAARRFGLALSRASDPSTAAAWADGFLRGSGIVLIHDDALFDVLNQWLKELPEDLFTLILPLLRRTFSSYPPPERRQIGERALNAGFGALSGASAKSRLTELNEERAAKVIPVISQLLGLTKADVPGEQP